MVVAALLAVTAIGCGSTETVTVTEEAAVPSSEPSSQRAERPSKPKKKKREARPAAAAPTEVADAGAAVPDVVGLDHQLAQDTLQAQGFYLIDEVDCSGADRMLLWDRNWIVVEQDPPAGATASADEFVTLCSVKDGE